MDEWCDGKLDVSALRPAALDLLSLSSSAVLPLHLACFACLGRNLCFDSPDTARTSALQCAYKLGIPYREGFIKNR